MQGQKHLLIVDDDKIHRVIYSSIAAKMDYHVDLADSPAAADAALRDATYDAVILDLMLGEESGAHVLALMSRLADQTEGAAGDRSVRHGDRRNLPDRAGARTRIVWPGAQTGQCDADPDGAEEHGDFGRRSPGGVRAVKPRRTYPRGPRGNSIGTRRRYAS